MSISACLIVRNEEAMIEGCLRSLKGAVDEIILVHHGMCEDNTLRIAKKYTKHVYVEETDYGATPEPLRHAAYKRATKEWVLIIDGDERLSKELQQQLPSLVQNTTHGAFAFRWPFYDERGKLLEKNTQKYKTILFRKSTMYKIGMPHMIAETRGTTQHLPLILEHHFRNEQDRKHRFRFDIQKNYARAKAGAMLLRDISRIPTYNCTLEDTTLKQRKKILFQRDHPLLAALIVPTYSFFRWFIVKGYWKDGVQGFYSAVNLPLYHLFLSWFIFCGVRKTSRQLPKGIRLAFGGDVANWKKQRTLSARVQKRIRACDLFVFNLEGPLINKTMKQQGAIRNKAVRSLLRMIGKLQPAVTSTPAVLDHVRLAKKNVACLANNHMLDAGAEAITFTRKTLAQQGFLFLGAGNNIQEAQEPLILNVKKTKIGILNYNMIGWKRFGLFIDLFGATTTKAGVHYKTKRRIRKEVTALASSVDYLIVVAHVGRIFEETLSQTELRFFESLDADIVITHHAHMAQHIPSDNVFSTGDLLFEARKDMPSNLLLVCANGVETIKV